MIERIFHPYWMWEEAETKMWVSISGEARKRLLQEAIEFTGNHQLYGAWMLRVIHEWPFSCAHNLSNVTLNRKAWLGRAACAHAFDCPEDIVREAWGYLTEFQQTEANYKAQTAINLWEELYAKKSTREERT
jgi:hypothetical protein